MRPFPGEEERSIEIRQLLSSEFDLAERVFEFWRGIRPSDWLDRSPLDEKVIHVSMTLMIQACRLFRSVLEECVRSEGIGSVIMTRSIFETAVALEFVLAPEVRIKAQRVPKTGKQKPDKFGNPKFVAVPGGNRLKPLTREFRATLYMASTTLQDQAIALEAMQTKGLKRFGKMYADKIDPDEIQLIEKTIGEKWCSILRGKKSYSGLSVEGTARILNKTAALWYETGYALQCRASHAGEAHKTVAVSECGSIQGQLYSDEGDIGFALYAATGFFLAILGLMEEHIGFGMKSDLDALNTEAIRIYMRE
jgi:hypothetical protein